MKLIIDERENQIFDKIHQVLRETAPTTVPNIEKKVLHLGDFIIQTDDDKIITIIERKTIADLLASIKDSRYEEQSLRLSNCEECRPENIIYIIEGSTLALGSKEKKLVYSVITSLHFFKGFRPIRTGSPHETAELLLGMMDKLVRNLTKNVPLYITNLENCEPNNVSTTPYCNVVKKVKKENITPENIGEIMLCQIPGISSVTAVAIMKHFTSFYHLLESCKNNPKCLENLQYESNGKTRKVNKSSIENIFKYFLSE